MPIYDYKCEKDHEFETQHSINDKLEECPICAENNESTKVTRLISKGSSFVLNGSRLG